MHTDLRLGHDSLPGIAGIWLLTLDLRGDAAASLDTEFALV